MAPYSQPGFLTRRVFDPLVVSLARRFGLSLEWHDTPVNPLTFAGQRYLVAPRGSSSLTSAPGAGR